MFWSDLRNACRNAARRPAFTILIALTLALGIGVNSAVFALLDAVLFKSLPYRDPSRLVFVWQTLPEHNVAELEPTPFDYAAWRSLRSFASVAMTATSAYTLAGDDSAERVRGARVTASLMPLLGIAPRLGRPFTADEDADSAAPVVILSDGLWRRRYGADPAILGRSIRVNGAGHAVVGVMPRAASLPGPLGGSDDLWLPARLTAAERDNEISHNYSVVARLADDATAAGAAAELEAFARRMAAEHPESHRGIGARLVAVPEQTTRGIRPTLLVAAGGVALLLLVACANAATLLMARAATKQHEAAIRAALGASRLRLLSLAMSESLLVAALGGAAGLALGAWAVSALVPLVAGGLPASATVGIDGRAAAFTAVLSAMLGVMFGLIVALQQAGQSGRLAEALRAAPRTSTAGASIARTRSALVVAQVALAVLLLSAAGLMVRSVIGLSRVGPGFDPSHVLTFRLSLGGSGYTEPARRTVLVTELMTRLTAVPGVTHASLTSMIPFGGSRGANGVEIEGRPRTPGESIIIDQRQVTPAYFQTMRIPIVRGRGFAATDDSRAERVVVINRAMADRYWPAATPIDHRVRVTAGFNATDWFRVVGVVENVRHISLTRDPVPEMYTTYAQAPVDAFTVVVRTGGEPEAAAPAVREALRALDSGLPLYDVRSMDDRIRSSFAPTRATMLLLAVTAALAAALAGVAIYGSIWYSVSQRIPEFGIRLALGASRASIGASVVRHAAGLSAAGGAIGITAAAAAGPLLSGLLFNTRPIDSPTYAVVAGVLAVLTIAASLVPARRAMTVDPIAALRSE